VTAPQFVSLSTTLIKDLQRWVSEARKDSALSEIDLALLQQTVRVIERATAREVDRASDGATSAAPPAASLDDDRAH
jgi:hypothetical protein